MAGEQNSALWERLKELQERDGASKVEAILTAAEEGLIDKKGAGIWLQSLVASDAEPRTPPPMAPSPPQQMPAPGVFPPSPQQPMPAPQSFPPSGAPAGGYAGPGPTFPPSGPPQMDPAMLAMMLRGQR